MLQRHVLKAWSVKPPPVRTIGAGIVPCATMRTMVAVRPSLIQTGGGDGPTKPGNRQAPRAPCAVPTPAASRDRGSLRDERHHSGAAHSPPVRLLRLLSTERGFFMPVVTCANTTRTRHERREKASASEQ